MLIPLGSARSATHKLVYDVQTGEARLYDLAADPEEQTDVAAAEPEVKEHMADRLLRHLARVTAEALEAELGEVSEEMQNRLRDLGY